MALYFFRFFFLNLFVCGILRYDPLSRASAFWVAVSEVAAGFTLSRSETTSLKARRYRDGALLCLPVLVFTCPV